MKQFSISDAMQEHFKAIIWQISLKVRNFKMHPLIREAMVISYADRLKRYEYLPL